MPVMNDEVPGEGDFDAGRRRGEFDDITWRILAVVATPGVFFGVATTARIRLSGVPESRQPPKLVEYFGACAVITLLHLWKRNILLSTAGVTAVYMLLIQLVF